MGTGRVLGWKGLKREERALEKESCCWLLTSSCFEFVDSRRSALSLLLAALSFLYWS